MEFYALSEGKATGNVDSNLLHEYLVNNNVENFAIKKEKEFGQLEIVFRPSCNIEDYVRNAKLAREMIISGMNRSGLDATFSGMPFRECSGNAMHINISLLDKSEYNVYQLSDDICSNPYIVYSLSGLCSTMKESMVFFSPFEASYQRYNLDIVSRDPLRYNSPTTISWGVDNRTVSLRVPGRISSQLGRRIEHRVPCADASIEQSVGAIILGIKHGIENRLVNLPEKSYGICNMHYAANTLLPQSLRHAIESYLDGTVLVRSSYLTYSTK